MWSVGCIMAELILREPIICGKTELDQLERMFKIVGTPNDQSWPGWRDLKFAKKYSSVYSKTQQCKLREKFPSMPLSKDDPMYLSDCGIDLLTKFFTLNPDNRISAEEALKHPWFQEHPAVADQQTMPKFPPMNEISRDQL